MAKLDFIEKNNFECLFEMGSGYVLDFSNRKFQEFVYSVMNIDIYSHYEGLSKGKILKRIIDEYDDVTVGKLLLELMRYMQATKKIFTENEELFKQCVEIGNRLIGKTIAVKATKSSTPSSEPIKSIIDYGRYLTELAKLTDYQDTPQVRGFAFERYLFSLFQIYCLDPKGSFKIVGEQIDGSFVLHNDVYLLEAKWTSKQINKADLVIFNEKVSSKSGFTRGLYISLAGYTPEALATFSNGRTVNIILMTVQEIAIILSRQLDLSNAIWQKVRALAEEGNFNKSIF